MSEFKRKINKDKIPKEFGKVVSNTINRIDENNSVLGLMFLKKDMVQMFTLPDTLTQSLSVSLPPLNTTMRRAITEIFEMKIVKSLLREVGDEWLVNLSAKINNINPIIDRIMEDESVEGVIMTNREGSPILSNLNASGAVNYALALHRFGILVQNCIKDLDPFDAVQVARVVTKKKEIMLVPDPAFNIIVLQQARQKMKKRHEREFIP